MIHVITIVLNEDGSVSGDLDDDLAIFPIGTESTAESTTFDGQARSVLDQALRTIFERDLSPKRQT